MSNIASLQIGQNKIEIGKSVLLKSYYDEVNEKHCRLYSDGYCEQFGYDMQGNGTKTITLVLSYIDTSYFISTVANSGSSVNENAIADSSNGWFKVVKTNSSCRWCCKGYVDLTNETVQEFLNL